MPYKDPNQEKNYRKDYYQKNKEREKNRSKNYYQTHLEQAKIWSKNSYETHKEKYLKDIKDKHDLLKRKIIGLLGNKCTNPFNIDHGAFLSDIRCLQIDHINGGGHKERQQFKSPWAHYEFIFEQIEAGSKDYQLLCANCNWIKKYENKETIHRNVEDGVITLKDSL